MAQKKITDYTLRDNVTDDLNYISDDGVQTYRVTAAQIKAYVLSLASIATDMIQDLAVTTAKLAAGSVTDAKTNFTAPTVQRFLAGSGTYTTPVGVKYIVVEMVGGGSGGAGAGLTSLRNGGNGVASTFGSSLLTAGGGGVSTYAVATVNSPAIPLVVLQGTPGSFETYGASWYYPTSGPGGNSVFGGAGASSGYSVGYPAAPNSGSGGSGGGVNATLNAYSGLSGSSGAYIKAMIKNPSATYGYSVGQGGAGGAGGGTNLYGGGAGGAGLIIVTEYYQ